MTSDILWDIISKELPSPTSPESLPSYLSLASPHQENIGVVDTPSVLSLIPEGTSLLALDISLHSTGGYIFTPTSEDSFNLPPLTRSSSPHDEVLLRRQLASNLLSYLDSHSHPRVFTHIVVEDAFSGRSKTVARTLYALNTFIDELILDNRLSTPNFERVNNVSWKARWSNLVGTSMISGLEDKIKVQTALLRSPWDSSTDCYNHLLTFSPPEGIKDTGLQDRLDSFAIGLSLFLPHTPSKKIPFKDIRLYFPLNLDILDELDQSDLVPLTGRVTKETIRTAVTKHPRKIFYTLHPSPLGTLLPKNTPDPLTPRHLIFHHKDYFND